MEDKDLDKLFQERFEGIESHPDPTVWDRISSSLDQKKSKKRLIPYWWLPAGIAAVMMMAFWIGGVFDKAPQEAPLPVIVDKNQESSSPESSQQESAPGEEMEFKTTADDAVVQQEVQPSEYQESPSSPAVLTGSPSAKSSGKKPKSRAIAQNNKAQNETVNRPQLSNETIVSSGSGKTAEETKEKGTRTVTPWAETAVAENDAFEKNKSAKQKETVQGAKRDLFQVLKEQEAVTDVQKDELGTKKWSLNAAIAPVYYNTLGEGSPIHSNFASNSKSGEVNMSYGVNLAYSLNKKLKIRSGVHRVDLGYTTDDIVFSSSLNASANNRIENINYGDNAVNLVVSSTASTNDAVFDAQELDIVAQSPAQIGQMSQQMRYLEIPLEMQYRFIDKKLSLDLIGGFSSLLLIDNQVSLTSEGRVTSMGEANNVNPLNFSTNLGIGVGYQLGTQWSLSVEPLFKYQLNTFDGDAGNFQPYSFGVYSGINFRF